MRSLLYRAAGRASNVFDLLRRSPARDGACAATLQAGRDRTGLLLQGARRLEVLHRDDTVLYVRYDSLAHSFWRAQELSLIRMHLEALAAPVLDFGAGDGSFASSVFPRLEWAVDTDPDALAVAGGYGLYGSLVQCTNDRIPLPDGAAGSIVSNSVLEHVGDLDAVLAELARVLRPGGRIAFTVPLVRFTNHLTTWFGARAAEAANRESSHRNLFEATEWVRRVERCGFAAEVVRHYQPDWFTYWYRMLRLVGPRGLGMIPGAQAACWRACGTRLVAMVRESITTTADGANVFILARKQAAP
jgi:SAM-dependent methyltransferase